MRRRRCVKGKRGEQKGSRYRVILIGRWVSTRLVSIRLVSVNILFVVTCLVVAAGGGVRGRWN